MLGQHAVAAKSGRGLVGPASAAPQITPEPTEPSSCLNGNSPPYDFVYDYNRSLGGQTRMIRYFCGTSAYGVLHTDDGHGPLGSDSYFLACIDLGAMGTQVTHQSNGNYLIEGYYGYGGSYYAINVVVEPTSPYISGEYSILTAYTARSVSGVTVTTGTTVVPTQNLCLLRYIRRLRSTRFGPGIE